MLLVDSHEPNNIIKLLKQSCPVTVAELNAAKMSDYWFADYEGKRLQFSRKQAGELVGNIDEAEDQLKDYFNNADENYQIVEGLITASSLKLKGTAIPVDAHGRETSTRDLGAKLFCYRVEPNGCIEKGHSFTAVNNSLLYAWLHRLARAGIVTYFTDNWVSTARLLSAIYRNEQKPPDEHQTLKRIIRPRIYIRTEKDMTDEERQDYTLAKSIMFVSSAYRLNIGETKAKAIARRYCNLYHLLTTSVSELAETEGIGERTATRILRALGRDL